MRAGTEAGVGFLTVKERGVRGCLAKGGGGTLRLVDVRQELFQTCRSPRNNPEGAGCTQKQVWMTGYTQSALQVSSALI